MGTNVMAKVVAERVRTLALKENQQFSFDITVRNSQAGARAVRLEIMQRSRGSLGLRVNGIPMPVDVATKHLELVLGAVLSQLKAVDLVIEDQRPWYRVSTAAPTVHSFGEERSCLLRVVS